MFICIWVLGDLTVRATCDPSNELKGLCNLGNNCLLSVHKISYIYSVHSKRVRSSERSSFLPSLNPFVLFYYNREATAVKAIKIRSALYETRNSPFEASNRRQSEEFRRHGSLWDAPVRAPGRQNVSVMFLLEEAEWEERRSYDGLCGERIWLGRWPGVCGRAEAAFDLSVCTSVCVCVCVCVCVWEDDGWPWKMHPGLLRMSCSEGLLRLDCLMVIEVLGWTRARRPQPSTHSIHTHTHTQLQC